MATRIRFHSPFHTSFFAGAGSSPQVPHPYPVAIDGHPYAVVLDPQQVGVWGARFKDNALPFLRSQADQSATPGEQSISPEGFWRRSQESWISGSGQRMQDRKTSIDNRFYTSKGINPWTPYQLSLLNDTTLKRASSATGLQLVINGTDIYMIDGTTLMRSTDSMATWVAVTGITGTPVSVCSDGTTVYVATATAIYSVTTGAASSYVAGNVSLCAYVNGRLMIAIGTILYNLTTNALPAALLTEKAGFTWVGFAEGQTQIYAAGYSGDKSRIYRTSIKADGTGLDVPIIAGRLPSGEIVRSIHAYLEYIVIGSDLGVRFCAVNTDGSLTIGALIPTTSPVYCFDAQDRFIWYGLTNYDSISSGLGRLDLTTFTSTLTPSYASDLMATGTAASPIQGAVRSVKTFGNYRIFTVDGHGLYAELLSTPVASGNLVTGWIGYDLSDPKVAVFLSIMHEPLNGTIAASLATDGGAVVPVGTSTVVNTTAPANLFQTNQSKGLQYQLTFTLTPSANVSPKLSRWTLLMYPAPSRSSQYMVPIILRPTVTVSGQDKYVDVVAEKAHLEGLLKSQNVVTYQTGNESHQVVMFDKQWLPEYLTEAGDWQGIFLAILNEITE